MSAKYEIRQDDRGWAVWKNSQWYSDVDDEQDGLGLVRNLRAKMVTIIHLDGFRDKKNFL